MDKVKVWVVLSAEVVDIVEGMAAFLSAMLRVGLTNTRDTEIKEGQ